MAPSFVRSSKFRHVFGTGAKRPDNAYEYASSFIIYIFMLFQKFKNNINIQSYNYDQPIKKKEKVKKKENRNLNMLYICNFYLKKQGKN